MALKLKNHENVEELVRFLWSKPFRSPSFIYFYQERAFYKQNKINRIITLSISNTNIISNFVILFCSFFAKYELPNLQVDKVSELMIIVAHTRSIPTGCDTDSIGMLKEDAKKSEIKKVTCYDDPKYVVSQLNIKS